MACQSYKLSCSLFGHSLDVRSLAVTQAGGIVTGSRDKTAKLWIPNELDNGFRESETYLGHSNFVSAVCVIRSSTKYPFGLIATGSNDKTINIYEPNSGKAIRVLKSHENTVCKIVNGIHDNIIISSSWDNTCKLWNVEFGKVLVTFTGHEAAVWSVVQLECGFVVSVSADKKIKVWQQDGACLSTLLGHTDCVRDVAAYNTEEFLTCSNDATVRHWNAKTGACLNTIYGHSNFIYSITTVLDGSKCSGFVTSSEDRTARLWSATGDELQRFSIPAPSVWCVSCLANGDIVTGSSDGITRVFTSDPARYAHDDLLSAYENQIQNANAAANQEVGGVKVSELPGPEALLQPGKNDGQTKLIKDGDKVVAYNWSAMENQWVLMGDVMGTADSDEAAKPQLNGKEYDFVFSVDIEEGKPPLKLPYNKSDDPWFAAQKFLHDNDLSQHYLEQVANFIITNAGLGQQSSSSQTGADYVDPFTGGARYIPQGTEGSAAAAGANSDPFTGNSSYNTRTQQNQEQHTSPYFPQRELVKFDQANLAMILQKLLIFNKTFETCSEAELEDLIQICHVDSSCSRNNAQTLEAILKWPVDKVFPALDVLRLAVRNPQANEMLCNQQLLSVLINFIQSPSASPNNMLAVRVLCNMTCEEAGYKLADDNRVEIINLLRRIEPPYNDKLQVAMTTLLLNMSVIIRKGETNEGRSELFQVADVISDCVSDEEAVWRWLIAVGTLLTDSTAQERNKLSIRLKQIVLGYQNKFTSDKLTNCLLHLFNILP